MATIGGLGNDNLAGGSGSDTLFGYGGADTLNGGTGTDILYGGDGDDLLLDGDTSRDTIYGGEGNDTFNPNGETQNNAASDVVFLDGGDDTAYLGWLTVGTRESIDGGSGNDTFNYTNFPNNQINVTIGATGTLNFQGTLVTENVYTNFENVTGNSQSNVITGNDVSNVLDGQGGDDTMYGAGGIDTLLGGEGKDLLYGGDADDKVYGGNAEDKIYGGTGADLLDGGESRDELDGADGNDTLIGGNGEDKLTGGDGDDSLDGGQGQDTLFGGKGDDAILAGDGDDSIEAGDGNDKAEGGQGQDRFVMGDGNDSAYGGTGDDRLYGGDGADFLDGGDNNDIEEGGDGNDTLTGGVGGVDSLYGGDDADTFLGPYGTFSGDYVDGGEGGTDNDTLNLAGLGPNRVIYDTHNPENGRVEFLDAHGNVTGNMQFRNIEHVVTCFTPGTLIATARGEVPVQALQVGDRVITRDNGMQPIAWVGRRSLGPADFLIRPEFRPVLIAKGALGHDLPERDMLVSPNHRMLLVDDRNLLQFQDREVLAAAKHLTGRPGITKVAPARLTYLHFMFDRHQVVLADGAWTESFQPGAHSMDGLAEAQREEILTLFPQLKTPDGVAGYGAARLTLKRHEARLLAR
jgi:Ca2+-binding RTX toxin-like protein